MALSHSPKIVTDSLVFMYDTDDGKSYKGEPTVNLATDSPSQGGWAGGREVLDSSRKKFRFIVNNFNASAGSGQGWRSFTWDLNSYSGQSITISATVEVPSASPGTFAWVMMGQTNTHTSNNSGAAQYMGYSAASERVQKTTTTTEHITWTGTVGSTGTASQPSGHVGFTLWYNGGTIGVDSYVEVSNVQVEINSHATQFVNGTRSATQGLLDRTGTSTIDISNVSFDSNAQMAFDGTDDYLSLGSNSTLQAIGSNATIECWFKSSSTVGSKFALMVGWGQGTSYYSNFGIGNWFSAWSDESIYVGVNSAAVVYAERDGSAKYHDGNWHHAVALIGQNNHKIFVDGSEVPVSFAYGSDSVSTSNIFGFSSGTEVYIGLRPYGNGHFQGDLPVVKIYDRLLTATEVLQNYNATKGRFS